MGAWHENIWDPLPTLRGSAIWPTFEQLLIGTLKVLSRTSVMSRRWRKKSEAVEAHLQEETHP